MKFEIEQPPFGTSPELSDWLHRQFLRIQQSLDVVYDGYLGETITPPSGQGQLILCTGSYYDFGDGVGVYARINGQWYKMTMRSVTRVTPTTGRINLTGNTPTVT